MASSVLISEIKRLQRKYKQLKVNEKVSSAGQTSARAIKGLGAMKVVFASFLATAAAFVPRRNPGGISSARLVALETTDPWTQNLKALAQGSLSPLDFEKKVAYLEFLELHK